MLSQDSHRTHILLYRSGTHTLVIPPAQKSEAKNAAIASLAIQQYDAFTQGLVAPSATSNYLRGLILQEQGQLEEAYVYLEAFLAADLDTDQEKAYITTAHRRLAEIYSILGIADKRDYHSNTYKELRTIELRQQGVRVLN